MEELSLLIFLHVLGALGMFTAFAIEGVAQTYLRRAATGPEVRSWADAYRIVPAVGGGSLLILLATGLWMTLAEWDWTGWIIVASISIIALAVLGATGGIRYSAAVQAAADEGGPLSAGSHEALSHPLPRAMLMMRVAMAIGIVFLMTVKPDLFGSLLAMLAAVLVGVAAVLAIGRRAPQGTERPLPR
jgi:hypothetical protein